MLENEIISTFDNVDDSLIIQNKDDKGFKVFIQFNIKKNKKENDLIKFLFVEHLIFSKLNILKILYTQSLKKLEILVDMKFNFKIKKDGIIELSKFK